MLERKVLTGHGPLQGVRIVEFDAIGPVPLCGMILSGLGAEIVRIRKPGGQLLGDTGDAVLLRGRRTVEFDLKNPADRDECLDLLEHADALMEGYRPGVMERLGLGPDICIGRNPALVYGRMTGWGQDGPLASSAGHDIGYIALTGALHAIAQWNSLPTVPLNLIGDYAGGSMFLALGLVSAILSARRSGEGQVVDTAIVDGVANLLGLFQALLADGRWTDQPASNLLDGAAPFYRCYACSDGRYVAVGPIEPQFFALLLNGLGIEQGRFEQSDREQWAEMAAVFAQRFISAPRDHWEAVFSGTDACVVPVLSMREAFTHPANAARQVFIEDDGIWQAAPAPRFSKTPGAIRPSRTQSAADLLMEWKGREHS